MGRVINTSNPGTRRSQLRRTVAELLRNLMLKRLLDEEAKDMAATLVFSLRSIAETIEVSTVAWEKRDYFLKADRFRREWEWALPAAERLQRLILNDHWEQLPRELAALVPYFTDVHIAKMTRASSTWQGNYGRLKQGSS